jgi:hypothetical protein
MVQVPGQHAIMYAANADGILACSTEHKDGCQMLWDVPKDWRLWRILQIGFFSAYDGGMYIYASCVTAIHQKVIWMQV